MPTHNVFHVEANLAIVILIQILVEIIHVDVLQHARGAFCFLVITQAICEFLFQLRKVL